MKKRPELLWIGSKSASWLLLLLLPVLAFPLTTAAGEGDQYTRAVMIMGVSEGYSAGMAIGLGYGLRLPHASDYLSMEGEIAKNFSHMSHDESGSQIKRSYARGALYLALTYPIDPRFDIKGKIGAHYTSFQDRGGNSTDTRHDSDQGMETGIGALIHFRARQDIIVEYTSTTLNDFTQLIVGMQLSF